MIRRVLIAVAITIVVTLGAVTPAQAAKPPTWSTSYTEIAKTYRCGEYKKGPHVGGYMYRFYSSRLGAVVWFHTDEPNGILQPVAVCTR